MDPQRRGCRSVTGGEGCCSRAEGVTLQGKKATEGPGCPSVAGKSVVPGGYFFKIFPSTSCSDIFLVQKNQS